MLSCLVPVKVSDEFVGQHWTFIDKSVLKECVLVWRYQLTYNFLQPVVQNLGDDFVNDITTGNGSVDKELASLVLGIRVRKVSLNCFRIFPVLKKLAHCLPYTACNQLPDFLIEKSIEPIWAWGLICMHLEYSRLDFMYLYIPFYPCFSLGGQNFSRY